MNKIDRNFLSLCRKGADQAALKNAVDAGANINVVDSNGRTGLILASIHHHHLVISFLMLMRANLNVKDNFGYTADDYLNKRDEFSQGRKHSDKEIKKGRFSKQEGEESCLVSSAIALADMPKELLGEHKTKDSL